MVVIIVGVVAAVVVVAGGVVVAVRRRAAATLPPAEVDTAPEKALRPEPAPMNGLESALAEVMDRSGRPIGERIDAEAPLVDELRSGDDSGPLLGRALDAIDRSASAHTQPEADAPDDAPDDGPDGPDATS